MEPDVLRLRYNIVVGWTGRWGGGGAKHVDADEKPLRGGETGAKEKYELKKKGGKKAKKKRLEVWAPIQKKKWNFFPALFFIVERRTSRARENRSEHARPPKWG